MLERISLSRFSLIFQNLPVFLLHSLRIAHFASTETALLELKNDIMETIDSGKITILTALDMAAAFDTLDHNTLLHTFGLSGYVISWIRSYLTDRLSFEAL